MATSARDPTDDVTMRGFLREHNEKLFVLGVLVGLLFIVLGLVFIMLGAAVDAAPPAPYFQSVTDRVVVIGLSVISIVVGVSLIQRAKRLVGW